MGSVRCSVRDVFALDSLTTERKFTDEGFLVAPGNIARTGIQNYYARELGLDDLPGERVVRLYRPVEEVSDAASIKSGENKPITVGHPSGGVNADNWRDLAVGEARDLCFVPDNAPAGGHIRASLLIKDAAAIKAVQGGKNQLSCGYTFDLDRTSGTTAAGEPYDGVMRGIRFNHHAIVDFARGGSGLRVADERTGESMATRKLVVDGFTLELPENEAVAVEKALGERAGIKTAVDELSKKLAASDEALKAAGQDLAKAKSDHAKELKAAKDQIPTTEQIAALAADRAKVLTATAKLCPELATDGKTVDEIRRAAVGDVASKNENAKSIASAIVGDDLSKASDVLVAAAFNALSVSVKDSTRTAGDEVISAALLSDKEGKDKTGTDAEPVMCARDAWIAKQQAK